MTFSGHSPPAAVPETLEAMVALGGYAWNGLRDLSAIPVDPVRYSAEGLELVHFGRETTTAEAEDEMGRLGLRPAAIEQLLAYGAANPGAQVEHMIVALGTSMECDMPDAASSPVLHKRYVDERAVHLRVRRLAWDADVRFLAKRA